MIVPITESEAGDILDMPFNLAVVASENDEDEIFNQWHEARNCIKSVFDKIRQDSQFGDDDYAISDRASLSRGIHVEISNKKLLSTDLIKEIQKMLIMLPEEYEVYVFVDIVDNFSDIFIQRHLVRAFMTDPISKCFRNDAT